MKGSQDGRRKESAVPDDHFRSLYESLPQGVFYQDADGRILQGNNSCLTLLGLTEDEFLGRTSLDPQWKVILPDGTDLAGENHPSIVALRTGKPVDDFLLGVFNPMRQDIVWMTVNAVPEFRDGEDQPFRVFVTMNDVTVRKAAQDALADSQFLLDHASVEVFRFDDEGIILYANRLANANLGYGEGDLQGRYLWDIDPSFPAETWPQIRNAVVERGSDERHSFHVRRDGGKYPVHVRTYVADQDGRRFFASFAEDASRIISAEEVLDRHESLRLLNNRIANAFLSSFGIQTYRRIIDFLPAYLKSPFGSLCYIGGGGNLICFTRGPTLKSGISENVVVLSPHEWLAPWDLSIREKVSIITDAALFLPGEENTSKNGICVPLLHTNEAIGLVILSGKSGGYGQDDLDLLESTARQMSWMLKARLDEEALRRQRENLEARHLRSQELETVGLLAGGIAQELNNLLTPVQGFGEILYEELEQQDHKDQACQITDAAKKARDLIHQLLAFGRKQDMEAILLDINGLLKSLQMLVDKSLRSHVTLDMNLQEHLPPIIGDPSELRQVMMNLILNAQDALEEGGTITIDTALKVLDAEYASTHEGVKEGSYVMIAVQDDGIGMEPEIAKNIFKPFFSTKERRQGTGMGLAAVYGTVNQLKGHIWVYSEPGHGSVFKIYLPVDENTEQPQLRPSHDPTKVERGGDIILVAEDNEQVLNLVRKTLEGSGYEVLVACDGNQALELFQRDPDAVSLLLTDVVMPGLNGQQLYLRIAERRPDLKVIYMSGYTDQILEKDDKVINQLNFIHKPFSINDLLNKVHEVLDADKESMNG